MLDYLKGLLEDFPEVVTGRSTIPAANHMLQVRPEDEKTIIKEEGGTAFHHTVAQLLFVTSSASKYIKMAIYFLCTQVRIPYEVDWGELVRVIRYIIGTLHLPLILRANVLSVIKWWVDASFAAHPD